jgi:hypothetical protein
MQAVAPPGSRYVVRRAFRVTLGSETDAVGLLASRMPARSLSGIFGMRENPSAGPAEARARRRGCGRQKAGRNGAPNGAPGGKLPGRHRVSGDVAMVQVEGFQDRQCFRRDDELPIREPEIIHAGLSADL